MDNGWIKLHRKMIDWEWFDDCKTFKFFMYCLFRANHKESKWRGINIKKGEFVSSLGNMSADTGISVQSIRTIIKRLKSTSELTSKTSSKYTVISITNWGQYQDTNKVTNNQSTNNQQTTNKQLTTDKNEKKEKNEKKLNGRAVVCKDLINYLNKKASKSFKDTAINMQFIADRLNEGYTEEEIRSVIDCKTNEWSGSDMAKYLRPATLFNATKFNQYAGETNTEKKSNYGHGGI